MSPMISGVERFFNVFRKFPNTLPIDVCIQMCSNVAMRGSSVSWPSELILFSVFMEMIFHRCKNVSKSASIFKPVNEASLHLWIAKNTDFTSVGDWEGAVNCKMLCRKVYPHFETLTVASFEMFQQMIPSYLKYNELCDWNTNKFAIATIYYAIH